MTPKNTGGRPILRARCERWLWKCPHHGTNAPPSFITFFSYDDHRRPAPTLRESFESASSRMVPSLETEAYTAEKLFSALFDNLRIYSKIPPNLRMSSVKSLFLNILHLSPLFLIF